MKSKLIGRLMSLSLSAVLAVSTFSVPAFAAEENLDLEEETVEFMEEATEEEADFEEEEFSFEDEDVLTEEEDVFSDDINVEDTGSEDPYAAQEEEADLEAVSNNNSNTITVIFHSNYRGKDTTVKRFFDKTNLDEKPINYTSLFTEGWDKLFIGWELDGEFKETVTEKEVVDYAVANNLKSVDIYAQWQSFGTYNIKFNAGVPEKCIQKAVFGYEDGTVIHAEVGEPVVLNGDEFEIPGYDLVGWTYKDPDGKVTKVNKAKATITDLSAYKGSTYEFTPVWKLGKYTITYDFNGGTYKGSNKFTYQLDDKTVNAQPLLNYVADENTESGFAINTASPELTRDGYTFIGWNGGYIESYGGTVFSDMTLTANWSANNYTVSWDGNGGTVYGEDVYSYSIAYNTTLSCRQAYREGYTLKGWKTKVKGKDKTFKLTDMIALKNIDRSAEGVYTFTAVWEADKNKLSYFVAGGSLKKAPKTFKTGDNTKIPDPVWAGYRFNGWKVEQYDDETEQYQYVNAEEAGIIKDGKLTAKATGTIHLEADWEPLIYNITFKNSDGSDLKDADGNPVTISEFAEVSYYQILDFAVAATQIEASGALKDKGVAGFAVSANAKKPTYKLNVNYSKFLAKSYDGQGTTVPVTLYVVAQEKVNRIIYNLDGGSIKKATYTFTAKDVTKDLAIKATANKTGWKFDGWTAGDDYDEYVVKNDKGFVTAIKAGTDTNVVLDAVYSDENKYTITLMPGASDVKNAEGNVVDSKKGELFKYEETTEFSYTEGNHDLDNPGWTRAGYYFVGFYKDSKLTKYAFYTTGLGSGKDTNVKVYAKWAPVSVGIAISDTAQVFRGTESRYIEESYIGVKFSNYQYADYGKKDITLKAIKAPGFTFKGYKIEGEITDDSGIVFTDSTKTYVKKIKKTNKQDLTLMPVFDEITYKVYVNPNGGTYKDGTGKALVAENVYYGQTLDEVYENITANARRSGYTISYVTTTKDYKGNIRQWRIDADGNYSAFYKSGLANKQGASVVLNLLWNKVNTNAPTMYSRWVYINGNQLTLDCNPSPSKDYRRIVFQYSTSADFTNNVKTYTWDKALYDEEGEYAYPTVTVASGKNYYVRARIETKDSTGEYYPGSWSSALMVTSSEAE